QVVKPGNRQPDRDALPVRESETGPRLTRQLFDLVQRKIRLAGPEKPMLVLEPAADPAGALVVGTEQRNLGPAGELHERIFQYFDRPVTLQVIGFDVVDDREARVKRQECLVVFVRLYHEDPVSRQLRIPAPLGDSPAGQSGWFESGRG